jgi:hypothetical protein
MSHIRLLGNGTHPVHNLGKAQTTQNRRGKYQWPNCPSFKLDVVQRFDHRGTSLLAYVPQSYHSSTLFKKCGMQV